jgi:3',5'-cyclic AMP phosphodiesterase CpdA
VIRILHVSDLHFGKPCVPEAIDAMEEHLHATPYDVVAVSGDVSQRSLSGEFQRAAAILRDARRKSAVIIVPGNHDVAWWMSPLHVFGSDILYTRYRRYISADLEPTLSVPGAKFVGVNTSHGVSWHTLTWRPRDVSIIGAVTPAQRARVRAEFAHAPPGDLRVVVMHHNPVRGGLSHRFGITRAAETMRDYQAAGVDLVLCGHDHQEAVHPAESVGGVVVCTAGTLSNRSRANRPSSFFSLTVSPSQIQVVPYLWNAPARGYDPQPSQCFDRFSRAPA